MPFWLEIIINLVFAWLAAVGFGLIINVPHRALVLCGNKSLCSAKIIMDDVKRVLTKKSAKPKFVFVHLEDTHYFSTFFSYDCKKVEQIEKELSDAEEYLDRISSEYRGNLMYDLSIRYVDKQIGKLFSAVKEKGNDKNTIICITADHGYSYNRFPLRERLVNNFHEEN